MVLIHFSTPVPVCLDDVLDPQPPLKQMRVLWVTYRDNRDSSSYRSF